MSNHQLLILAVIAFGFLAVLAGIVILAYLLLVDLLSVRDSSSRDGSQDMPAPPRGPLTPTYRGVREVGAGELPPQMWTGRGIV